MADGCPATDACYKVNKDMDWSRSEDQIGKRLVNQTESDSMFVNILLWVVYGKVPLELLTIQEAISPIGRY